MKQRIQAALEQRRERYEFKQAFESSTDDERYQMIQDYITENSEDKFIRKIEKQYHNKQQRWIWPPW